MADLSRHKADFQKSGAAVYAVSNEDAAKLNQMRDAEKLDFVTFLSDPDGAAAKKYAGLYPGSMTHQPGSFVIDKHGRSSMPTSTRTTRAARRPCLCCKRSERADDP